MKNLDTVLIGQGIAGTLIAHRLIQKKIDFLLIDNNHHKSSSRVAAGLYNPVVFLRPTLSFNVQKTLPHALETYKELEKRLNSTFLYQRPYWKFFESYKTINDWEARASDPKFRAYIKLPLLKNPLKGIKNTLPYAETLYTGNVNLTTLLDSSKQYFEKHNCIVKTNVVQIKKHEGFELLLSSGESIQCKRLILARGSQEKNHSEFSHTTIDPTKGEILTIKCEKLRCNYTLSKGFFILPIGGDYYKLGATYDWKDKTDVPSIEAKNKLIKQFESLVNLPYTIVKHESGLRPSVKDRRPLLGEHPTHKNLFIFNGLGSKGVLLAPYYANQLVEHIFELGLIEEEVNVERMKKYYGNTQN